MVCLAAVCAHILPPEVLTSLDRTLMSAVWAQLETLPVAPVCGEYQVIVGATRLPTAKRMLNMPMWAPEAKPLS